MPHSFDSASELRTTLTSIGDGVISTDGEGKIRFMNIVAERLMGWALNEAIGRPLDEVFHIVGELSRKQAEKPAAKVQRTGQVVELANRTTLISRDGTEHQIDYNAAPMRDVVLVFREATEKHIAERHPDWCAAIVEHSIDAIVGKDLAGRVVSWNSAAERIFGYPAAEMIGQPIIKLMPPDQQNEEQDILARIRHGESVETFESIRVRKDGRQIHVGLSISPVKDREGHIIGGAKIARDITRQREKHSALLATRQELEQHVKILEARVHERTADLETFSYSLSHDLRAPLRSIKSFTQIVLEDYRLKLDAEAVNHLERVVKAGKRMDRLIEDVLLFCRLSQREIVLGPINVEKTIDAIIAEHRGFRSPEIELQIDRPLLPVRGNSALITQCIMNMMSNAVKFVMPGGIPRVRIYTEEHEDSIRLCIEDRGIGISLELQPRLFGLFQKLHSAGQYSGTGMGLAIVKKAVERMNGSVGAESELGKGSCFWIQLPKL